MHREEPLTSARIARFYIPLALSWLFMSVESPVCVAVLSRLPHPEVNTAAFNILMSVAIFIECPVIDLLSTSTTLSRNWRDFAVLSRFVWMLMLLTGLAHALFVFTPIYGLVVQNLMGIPEPVAETARLGLGLMILWSPAIAWRRYRQGLLIRFHRTRMVGYGTAIRVGANVLTNLALFYGSRLSGIEIVGISLVASVVAESLFIHLASRDVVREHLSPQVGSGQDERDQEAHSSKAPSPLGSLKALRSGSDRPLDTRALTAFHMPLVLTTMVILVGSPVVSAFLSKSPNPVLTLAAWQVAFSLLWTFRTITFALPEVVITLYRDEDSARKLRDFCVKIGVGTSGLALAAGLAQLDVWFFLNVLKSTPETSSVAHVAFLASAPLAFLTAVQSYVRGMLTAHHLNVARFTAVAVGFAALIAALGLGLLTPWRGVLSGALALNICLIAELAVLVYAWRRGAAAVRGAASVPA